MIYKIHILTILVFFNSAICLLAQDRDISYMSSGGKLNPLQANMDIRYYNLVPGEQINSADTYTGDIYVKGAFFMHTLRYVLGDSLFFPTLKKLATDKKYTYDNFVTTDDVEQLFSKESGKDSKPLFDFYLRTTQKVEFNIRQKGTNTYTVQGSNLPMPLPVEIITDNGTQKILMTDKKIMLKTSTLPVIDAKRNYLKKIVVE